MANKSCSKVSCFLSSCCQTAEFQNTCPNRLEKFPKGHRICDEAKDSVQILLSGVGLVVIGVGSEEEMPLALLGKGQVFGVLTPFVGDGVKDKWNISLQALTDLEVCNVPCVGLKHYTMQHPSILYDFILASKSVDRSGLRQTWIRSPRKICDRVLRALVVLHELLGRELTISHDDMALIVSADRPSVTLALDKLRDEGLVTLKYRRIWLNTTLTSNELESTLNPDCDHRSLLPSLVNGPGGSSPDMHFSVTTTTH